jgi:SAM-dependent methyltransferase
MSASVAYGPLCALFYDADKPAAPADEVAWYAQRLPRDAGPLLEPMCGSGRLLVPLVGEGFNVHGVDSSAAMLAHCESRLAGRGDKARIFRQDIAELNLPFRYAAAFIAAGSFQLVTDPARARGALAHIRSHLVPPGRLIVDLFVPAESEQRIAAPLVEVRSVTLPDGTRIALRSETTMHPDARLARTASRYVHRRGNDLIGEESETMSLTWYAPDDIVALVRAAGFTDVEIGASPRPTADSTTFALTARAP